MMRYWGWIGAALLLFGWTLPRVVIAQQPVAITLSAPQLVNELVMEGVIADFEAAYPWIDVYVVSTGGIGSPVTDGATIDETLDNVRDYVQSADVLMVDAAALTPEATRAGYYLDLSPLVNADFTLDTADFYPAVWESYQWDGGIWAIPTAADATLLYYNPVAFDEVGLAYPTPNWSIVELEQAIRALAQFNPDGTTARPGMIYNTADLSALLIGLTGAPLIDEFVYPNAPNYSNPAYEDLLARLVDLRAEGYFSIPEGFSPQDAPMQLGQGRFGRFRPGQQQTEQVAVLPPGGQAGLSVSGFAVSAASSAPDAAYELAKYLSYRPEVATALANGIAARQSLANTTGSLNVPGRGGFNNSASTEATQMGLLSGIPVSAQRFSDGLISAIQQMIAGGLDARTALDAVELERISDLAVADARWGTETLTVALPPALQALAAGEVRLTFLVGSFINPLPNQSAWEDAVAEFVAQDAQVGQIVLDVNLPRNVSQIATDYDCFYLNTNQVAAGDLSLFRSLDPLMQSDPNFYRDALVATTLTQVQRDGQTWAFPMEIQPMAIRYNEETFAVAGVFTPGSAWSVTEFEDTLYYLQNYLEAGDQPFQPATPGNAYLLALIAAYGGLPIDNRGGVVDVNLTDAAAIEAIREVLGLAQQDLMLYRELATGGGGGFNAPSEDAALTSEILNAGGRGLRAIGRGGQAAAAAENTNPLVTFPAGSQYTAVIYELGAGYISSQTTNFEACYRFLSHLSRQPDLWTVMPANGDHLSDPALAAAQGVDKVEFYRAVADLLAQPNTLTLRATGSGAVMYWMNRAFDRFVLEDADLEAELAEAQVFTEAYQECVAQIPPFDPAIQTQREYNQQFNQCALSIDPSVAGFLGG